MPHSEVTGAQKIEAARLAYSIEDLPYGRTFAYQLIKEGKLRALKCGRRTIITAEAWKEHVAALPQVGIGEVA